ncbi:MAG TPA: isocitrate lyase/PEP mutase family protein [Reyranella sp.]|jgi:2-methylisocitrate lyase-like PEP mutase family enzyme|nr:isocitrate lyase/PEP mutase family protein [Reyranella sp.]
MSESKTKARRLRELLRDARPVVSPGIYDGYSARLVQKMGFKTAATTGAGLTNSLIVQPDIGIFGLRDNVDACRHLARSVDIPLTADADTGYGNAVTVYHVVQYFEEAGIVGVNIEDQVMPKRCGHMRGKELISISEMTKKIEAGLKAKKDQDFIINARTDAIAVEDIAGTVKRVKAYSKAGADMIYVDAIRGEDDIARAVEAAGDTPVNINMGFFIRQRPTSPLLPLKRLKELGVARVSSPRMLTSAAISGMRKALEVMQQCMITGELADRPDLTASMEEITELFDYEKIAALETAFSVEEDLERKYRDKERSYVVRSGTKQ